MVVEQTAEDTPTAARDRAWFFTLAHTGVRISELLNLRLGGVEPTLRQDFGELSRAAQDTASLTSSQPAVGAGVDLSRYWEGGKGCPSG